MSDPTDVRTIVRAALETAGLSIMEHEFEELVEKYPGLRDDAAALYKEALRYEEPALLFRPVVPEKAG